MIVSRDRLSCQAHQSIGVRLFPSERVNTKGEQGVECFPFGEFIEFVSRHDEGNGLLDLVLVSR